MIYKGKNKVIALYKGAIPIIKAYKGNTLLFEYENIDDVVRPNDTISFKFTDSVTFNLNYVNSSDVFTFTADSSNSVDNGDGTYTFTATLEELGLTEITNLLKAFNTQPNLLEVYLIPSSETLTSLANAFYYNSGLTSIDLTDVDTSNVDSMSYAFAGNTNLKEIKGLDKLDTSKVTTFNMLFYNDSKLEEIPIEDWDVSSANSLGYMFIYHNPKIDSMKLTRALLAKKDLSTITDFSGQFAGLDLSQYNTDVDITDLDTSNIQTFNQMFMETKGMKTANLSGLNTSNVLTINSLFAGCVDLEELDLSNWDISKVSVATSAFNNTPKLKKINLSGWNCTNPNLFLNNNGNGKRYLFLPPNSGGTLEEIVMNDCSEASIYGMVNYLPKCNYRYLTKITTNTPCANKINFDGTLNFTYSGTSTTFKMNNKTLTADTSNSIDNGDGTYTFNHKIPHIGEYTFTSGSTMFSGNTAVVSIDSVPDTYGLTNLETMFRGCTKVKTIDASNIDLSTVTNVGQIFRDCYNLTDIVGVEDWNTSNVNSFGIEYQQSGVFTSCSKLNSMDLSNWDTSKSNYMSYMFSNCGTSGNTLNISNWVLAPYCKYMFRGCKYSSIILDNVDTSKVTDMQYMFSGCTNVNSLDISNFNTSAVTNMSNLFNSCSGITSLDVSNWNTSKVTNMSNMFSVCVNLTSLDVSNFNTSKVTDMSYMFNRCSNLTSLDLSNFNTSAVTDMNTMFNNCSGITSLDVSNFNTSKVTNMYNMFYNCKNIASLDVSNFNTSAVTDMGAMFFNCSNLTLLDLSNFNTSNVTDMNYMFGLCSKLTSLDLSNFNTSKVTNIGGMFSNCSSLRDLVWNNFGNGSGYTEFDISSSTNLGVNNDDCPNARQHLTDTFVTNSFDRASNGYPTLTIKFNSATRLLFTEDEIAQMTSKGYTIA